MIATGNMIATGSKNSREIRIWNPFFPISCSSSVLIEHWPRPTKLLFWFWTCSSCFLLVDEWDDRLEQLAPWLLSKDECCEFELGFDVLLFFTCLSSPLYKSINSIQINLLKGVTGYRHGNWAENLILQRKT